MSNKHNLENIEASTFINSPATPLDADLAVQRVSEAVRSAAPSDLAEFVSHLKSLDVQVFIEGDSPTETLRDQEASLDKIRLRCSAPEGTLTTELCQELASRKAELVSYLLQQKAEGSSQRSP